MSLSSGTRVALSEGLSWALAGVMLVVGIVYFDDVRSFATGTLGLPGKDEVISSVAGQIAKARGGPVKSVAAGEVALQIGRDGHFHADAEVNGRAIEVMVDTGASMVALTFEDAEFDERELRGAGVGAAAYWMLSRLLDASLRLGSVSFSTPSSYFATAALSSTSCARLKPRDALP